MVRWALIAALAAIAPGAAAQTAVPPGARDSFAAAHTASANRLGLLQYCQAQGAVGADAVSAARNLVLRLPASGAPTGEAEALGRQGIVQKGDGSKLSAGATAMQQNLPLDEWCRRLGRETIQAGMRSGTPMLPAR